MAVEHESYPMATLQFLPENLLTLEGDLGRCLIRNLMRESASENVCCASTIYLFA